MTKKSTMTRDQLRDKIDGIIDRHNISVIDKNMHIRGFDRHRVARAIEIFAEEFKLVETNK